MCWNSSTVCIVTIFVRKQYNSIFLSPILFWSNSSFILLYFCLCFELLIFKTYSLETVCLFTQFEKCWNSVTECVFAISVWKQYNRCSFLPIMLWKNSSSILLFFYLSFEHPIFKTSGLEKINCMHALHHFYVGTIHLYFFFTTHFDGKVLKLFNCMTLF